MPFVRFRSPRPRNPVLRILVALVGVAVLGIVLLFGLFAALGLLLIGGVGYLVRHLSSGGVTAKPQSQAQDQAAPDGVLEGEFVVIREPSSRLPR